MRLCTSRSTDGKNSGFDCCALCAKEVQNDAGSTAADEGEGAGAGGSVVGGGGGEGFAAEDDAGAGESVAGGGAGAGVP